LPDDEAFTVYLFYSSFPVMIHRQTSDILSSHFFHQPTRLEQQISNMSVGSDYGRQNSYPSPPVPQSPSHPPGAPAPPAPGPYYGAPKAPASPITPPAPRPQPVIPDAVLNMAAKGEPDKKPWSYAPDMESIKEQRDKVRRRSVGRL